MMMTSFATGYLQIYLAMGIGHLVNKHRSAVTFIAFIGINAVVSTVTGRFLSPVFDMVIDGVNTIVDSAVKFHSVMWIAIAGELVLCAIYFAGTEFILRKKLNLE